MRLLLDVSAVPTQPVGAGVYTVCLATELDTRDTIEMHLLTRSDDGQRWSRIAPNAIIHAVVPNSRPARLAWEQVKAPALAIRLDIDVWHGPHYTMPLRCSVPAVVTVHDLTFFEHAEWHERSKTAFFKGMIRASVKRAKAIVAVSGHTRDRLDAVLHPSAPIVIAPHGVDHERFRVAPRGDTADIERLAHLGIRPPYIAFAGLLEPRKDVPNLIDAFARVARRHPELRLVLAGRDGWGADAVRDAISSSGFTTRIMRTGWFPDEALAALFRQAELVAYPSLEEGFGLPALEALACGAALITTTGSAMEEVAHDSAVLVPPSRPDVLAEAINTVLDNPVNSLRLRTDGPKRAATFSWERSGDLHLKAYQTAIVETR